MQNIPNLIRVYSDGAGRRTLRPDVFNKLILWKLMKLYGSRGGIAAHSCITFDFIPVGKGICIL